MWDRTKHAEILADAEKTIPRLAKLGGRTLGTSVGAVKWGQKTRKTPEQLDAQAELLRKIIGICDQNGVVLNLHNHTYEVENELHDLKGTLARIPDVKLGPDLNWLVRGGVDPVAFIRQYGKQIVFLHLRDQKKDGRWSEALGEGDMDYAGIAAALREINFAGHAIIELAHERDFKPTRPLRESLKMSREFVRKTLGY
jgi:sugar phosphate isomerase/epimerase